MPQSYEHWERQRRRATERQECKPFSTEALEAGVIKEFVGASAQRVDLEYPSLAKPHPPAAAKTLRHSAPPFQAGSE